MIAKTDTEENQQTSAVTRANKQEIRRDDNEYGAEGDDHPRIIYYFLAAKGNSSRPKKNNKKRKVMKRKKTLITVRIKKCSEERPKERSIITTVQIFFPAVLFLIIRDLSLFPFPTHRPNFTLPFSPFASSIYIYTQCHVFPFPFSLPSTCINLASCFFSHLFSRRILDSTSLSLSFVYLSLFLIFSLSLS